MEDSECIGAKMDVLGKLASRMLIGLEVISRFFLDDLKITKLEPY